MGSLWAKCFTKNWLNFNFKVPDDFIDPRHVNSKCHARVSLLLCKDVTHSWQIGTTEKLSMIRRFYGFVDEDDPCLPTWWRAAKIIFDLLTNADNLANISAEFMRFYEECQAQATSFNFNWDLLNSHSWKIWQNVLTGSWEMTKFWLSNGESWLSLTSLYSHLGGLWTRYGLLA